MIHPIRTQAKCCGRFLDPFSNRFWSFDASRLRPFVVAWWVVFIVSSSVFAQAEPNLSLYGDVPALPPLSSVSEGTDFHSRNSLFIGSRSCASSGCHGDPRRETVVGAAANYFLDRDRHQLAGSTLRNQRSREIIARLKRKTDPWETRECLVCHAPGAVDVSDRSTSAALLSEGVGCESCHGGARQWLVPHRSVEWNRSDFWSSSRKADVGFVQTKDLSLRIDQCADCHVGNANQSVNHDLIAAGHPRLAFEFAAYQSRMPIHWRHANERLRSPVAHSFPSSNRSTYEARNWLIGQIVNADHELEILLANASQQKATGDHPKSTWPELAQYDCFACHHDLSSPSWRQARSTWNLRPGELPWGTWSLGLIAEAQPAIPTLLNPSFVTDEDRLREQMKNFSTDPDEVVSLVLKLRQELARSKSSLVNATLSPEELTAIRHQLLAHRDAISQQGWDRSTQLFLAAVALEKGANDAVGAGNRVIAGRQSNYEQLRDLLSFKESGRAIPPFSHRESPARLELNWSKIRVQFDNLQSSDARTNGTVPVDQTVVPIPPLPTIPGSGD